VDAAQALADLTEISSQIMQVAIVDGNGSMLATTFGDDQRSKRFVEGVMRLVEEADVVRKAHGLPGLAQLEAATLEGSIFVVRNPTGSSYIAALTRPEPTVGLVFYDLKHCLRSIGAEQPETKSPARAKRGPVEGAPGKPEGSPGKESKAKKADASA
jgi:hypothetical protein